MIKCSEGSYLCSPFRKNMTDDLQGNFTGLIRQHYLGNNATNYIVADCRILSVRELLTELCQISTLYSMSVSLHMLLNMCKMGKTRPSLAVYNLNNTSMEHIKFLQRTILLKHCVGFHKKCAIWYIQYTIQYSNSVTWHHYAKSALVWREFWLHAFHRYSAHSEVGAVHV